MPHYTTIETHLMSNTKILGMAMPIPVFVINLDRRPDRWKTISEHLNQIGLVAERIPAIDARDLPDEKQPRKINPGSAANILGHAHAMRRLLESDASAALILEDDAELSQDTMTLLRSFAWWPEDAKVVRLEAGRDRRRFLRLPAGRAINGRAVCRMEGHIPGSAVYLINRDGAHIALSALTKPELTIDQTLFDLKKSRAARHLRPYQIVPPMAHQRDHGKSDIEPWRKQRPQRRPLAQTLRSLPYKVHLGILMITGRVRRVDLTFRNRP